MFKYNGFIIEREKDNVVLYREEQVAVIQEGTSGRGKGRGTPTGETKLEKVWKGYFNTFKGAFGEMVNRLSEEGESVESLITLVERLEKLKADGLDTYMIKSPIQGEQEDHEVINT